MDWFQHMGKCPDIKDVIKIDETHKVEDKIMKLFYHKDDVKIYVATDNTIVRVITDGSMPKSTNMHERNNCEIYDEIIQIPSSDEWKVEEILAYKWQDGNHNRPYVKIWVNYEKNGKRAHRRYIPRHGWGEFIEIEDKYIAILKDNELED